MAIATLGSFSAAARAEGVTPALIARRLDALEQRLRVRLFLRSTRRLVLTTEGHTLLAEVPGLLEQLAQTEARVGQGKDQPVGLLRVTAPAGFGRRHVAPLLPGLQEKHPGLIIALDLSDHFVDLVQERFDLAIRVGELTDSSLVGLRLADNQRVVVGAPAYLKARGAPSHPRELANHACLALAAQSGQSRGWLFREQNQTVAHRVGGPLACSDGSVLHAWCLAGLGLAWRSLWEVQADIRQGRLITVLDDYRAPANGIFALMPERRLTPFRVQVLIAWLKSHYQAPGYFD